jgi:hypothetical protein
MIRSVWDREAMAVNLDCNHQMWLFESCRCSSPASTASTRPLGNSVFFFFVVPLKTSNPHGFRSLEPMTHSLQEVKNNPKDGRNRLLLNHRIKCRGLGTVSKCARAMKLHPYNQKPRKSGKQIDNWWISCFIFMHLSIL